MTATSLGILSIIIACENQICLKKLAYFHCVIDTVSEGY